MRILSTGETAASPPSLQALASRINQLHAEGEELARSAIDRAVACGLALCDAKKQVPHGEWGAWLKSKCPRISDRTARAYMQVALNIDRLKSAEPAVLTIEGALKLLAESKPNHLPAAGHKVYGAIGGALIELIAAEDPEFVFISVSYHQTGTDLDGKTDVQKRAVRRTFAEMVLSVTLKAAGLVYDPAEVTWGEPEACETPTGHYFPGYVPDWKQPGWAENRKRQLDEWRTAGTLEANLLAEGAR